MRKKKEIAELRASLATATHSKSMVGGRLARIMGKVDVTGINRILDIGSWHLGQSMEFARLFPGAVIDAFEPVPRSYELCLANRARLDEGMKERIRVHNQALSNTEGETPFYAVDTDIPQKIDAGFSSLFKFSDGLKNSYYGESLVQKEIRVTTTTLDNWCAGHGVDAIDIIWMDVQGAELLVLQGAERMLRHTRIIMTEVGLKPYYEGHTVIND